MNESNLSHKNPHKTDWHSLGELEVPVGSDSIELIYAQMKQILEPLPLHPDFQNKILISAKDVVARSLPAEVTVETAQIHILVYVPTGHSSSRGTWGFFHVEKIEFSGESSNTQDRTIEFYLYVERQ